MGFIMNNDVPRFNHQLTIDYLFNTNMHVAAPSLNFMCKLASYIHKSIIEGIKCMQVD